MWPGAHVQLFCSLGILSFIHTGSFITVGSGIDAVVALCFPNTCVGIRFSAYRERHVSVFIADLFLPGSIGLSYSGVPVWHNSSWTPHRLPTCSSLRVTAASVSFHPETGVVVRRREDCSQPVCCFRAVMPEWQAGNLAAIDRLGSCEWNDQWDHGHMLYLYAEKSNAGASV